MDWASVLDFETSAKNVRGEFYGDWFRDPWEWPEIKYLLASPELLREHIATVHTHAPALIDVPKENWGTRPAVVLSIEDRLTYQALVDAVSVDLIGGLHESAYGWRLKPDNPRRGDYSRNDLQWDQYRSHLGEASRKFEAGLRTDLVSCFASIPLDKLQASLEGALKKNHIQGALIDFIERMYRTSGRTGLPQRSLASAVIANMYMKSLDDVLDHHASDVPRLVFPGKTASPRIRRSWTRWMDDVWLFGDEAGGMRRAQIELQQAASAIGMHINSAKTDVFEGEEVPQHALEIVHSAVDESIGKKEMKPLEELIDRLLDDPSHAARTSLKFVTNRMRNENHPYRIAEFSRLAERMPHAADSLAPLLAKSFGQGDLEDWFLEYATGPWASFDWSLAHYLRMFPCGTRPSAKLVEFVAQRSADSRTSIVLLSMTIQRLTAWDDKKARGVLTSIERQVSHPQNRRIMALAGNQAGVERHKVKQWLSSHSDNQVTLKMLQDANFGKPRISSFYTSR